jgi:uncharacterized protein YggE
VLLGALALLVVACTPAVNAGQVAPAAPTGGITVVGQGEASGAPDQAQVMIGVETLATTVQEATDTNQANVAAIMAALEEQGIAAKDIQTSNYSLWPEQRYDESGPTGITGYRVSNQVNVTIRDINRVGDVLGAAMDAGANSIYGVSFSVDDTAALEAEARAAAIADARTRAESLASLSGLELGDVQMISEVVGQPVMPYGGGAYVAAESAVAAPGISPGQLNYNVQVQVTFGIK